jgi:hypothetical protein
MIFRRGRARLGMARLGSARQGGAWCGSAGLGSAWFGEARNGAVCAGKGSMKDITVLTAWIVLALAGLTAFIVHDYRAHPSAPYPCTDSMHIVELGSGFTCSPGTKQAVQSYTGTVAAIVTCTCVKP